MNDLIFEKYFNKNKIKLFKINISSITKQINKFDLTDFFEIPESPHTEIWKFVRMELKNGKKILHFESEAKNLIEITTREIQINF